jgi:hypothetical protein
MAIRIKRSSANAAPSTLASGQLAYAEGTGGSANGGTLYVGTIAGAVVPVGGNADHTKLAGIETGAQVNTVTSVAGRTGAVVITTADLANFNTASDARIAAANLGSLANVNVPTPSNGQHLTYDSATSKWIATAPSTGVTAFIQLNDVPTAYTAQGGFFVRVNAAANALEFIQDIDDGTF